MLTPKAGWQERFLVALSKSPSVARACRAAGISRVMAYREKRDNPEFAERWQEIHEASLDELERVAHRRAAKSSDTLIIFLLKSHRRATYGDKVTLGGDPDAPLFKVLAGVDPDEV